MQASVSETAENLLLLAGSEKFVKVHGFRNSRALHSLEMAVSNCWLQYHPSAFILCRVMHSHTILSGLPTTVERLLTSLARQSSLVSTAIHSSRDDDVVADPGGPILVEY